MADFKVTELSPDTKFDQLRFWDVVIIGAGPAGLVAGLTTAYRWLTTLVIEAKNQAGGQPQFLCADKRIVDVPGFPDGITGEKLSARVYRQAVDALVPNAYRQSGDAGASAPSSGRFLRQPPVEGREMPSLCAACLTGI